jgi:hypothetical protein
MNKSSIFSSAVLRLVARVKSIGLALGLSMVLLAPGLSHAGRIDEPPTPQAMIGDVMVRPIMAGATLIGAGLYVATLPLSLLGGNAAQAGDVLVVKPFQATFMRCLGCTNTNAEAFGGTQDVD